jgi:hypothetical protein
MADDPDATRRRLAEAEAKLAADPENPALALAVDRLQLALESLEWWGTMERLGERCRMILSAARRKN